MAAVLILFPVPGCAVLLLDDFEDDRGYAQERKRRIERVEGERREERRVERGDRERREGRGEENRGEERRRLEREQPETEGKSRQKRRTAAN